MNLIKTIKSKILARKVKDTTREACDMYRSILNSILNPLPELAEDLANIVVTNQDEIERTIVLATKIKGELEVVLRKHNARINDENKELAKLMNKFVASIHKRWK